MPKPRRILNAFTAEEVSGSTGISRPMIDYLLRAGYLSPAYGHGTRGQVRYYSYRDLVVAQVLRQLRDAGVELSRLKSGIRNLSSRVDWLPQPDGIEDSSTLTLIVSDGNDICLKSRDDFLEELTGQRSFAFVVNLESVRAVCDQSGS